MVDVTGDGSDTPPESQKVQTAWSPPLPLIIVALIVLGFSLVVGVQLFGVLFALVFPPDAPVPPRAVQVEYENLAHGKDRWRYELALDPCEVAAFYESHNSTCVFAEAMCSPAGYVSLGYRRYDAAYCIGTSSYSIFGLRWEVLVETRFRDGAEITILELDREVLWGGIPQATSTPPLE
jgi:hypothetical protein